MSLTRLSGSVYAGGQVEGGVRVNGRIVEPDIGVAVRQGRCGAAYFLLLVCFFLPPLFSVAVSGANRTVSSWTSCGRLKM